MSKADLLIFDLDGTLLDSKQDLADSINATRVHMGHPTLPPEVVLSYVGNGAPVLVKRALPGATEAQIEEGLKHFLDYYREHMLDATTLYPGVREALDEFHQAHVPMAVLTNKPVRFSVQMMEGLGLDLHFRRIYGGNSFVEKKPHPMGIDILVAETGAARERTIMVGDSSVDILTARNARVQSCGVSWGFQPETFAQARPDILVDDMRDLARMVLG